MGTLALLLQSDAYVRWDDCKRGAIRLEFGRSASARGAAAICNVVRHLTPFCFHIQHSHSSYEDSLGKSRTSSNTWCNGSCQTDELISRVINVISRT